uniref:Uncharacterized protein n=1 Tax=Iconisemion striatum TaxID=60296 RepID=A0A1A7WT36_9TELE
MFKTKTDEQTGTKILLDAMSKDKVHLARFVLDALDGGIVDSRTEGALTPLISSILLPDDQTRGKFIELLLQKGASVNYQDGSGRSALSYACEKGHLDAVKILVRNNADPEIEDSWGNTALMYAAAEGHSPVVEFLVRAFKRLGLRIHRQNQAGNSAVSVAKFLGHAECVFALTNFSNRTRDADGGVQGDTQPLLCAEFEGKVGDLTSKLEVLQTCDRPLMAQNSTWQQRPQMKQNRLRSIDSTDEFGGENESFRDLVFSGELTTAFPSWTCSQNSQQLKTELLPPIFFSPQANRNSTQPSTSSTLGVLLTPIPPDKNESDMWKDKSFCLRKLNDSYYRKRCSLPTSMLSPAPPGRTLVPVRKTRTVRRREEVSAPPFSSTATASSATTFSTFSNKLFRRFTSPEFKKNVRDLDPVLMSSRIPRSETFPQAAKHPQVDSTPSINSISSVKCEFDCLSRKPE